MPQGSCWHSIRMLYCRTGRGRRSFGWQFGPQPFLRPGTNHGGLFTFQEFFVSGKIQGAVSLRNFSTC